MSTKYEYKESENLTTWTINILYAYLVVLFISIISNYMEYDFLYKLNSGAYHEHSKMMADANISDNRQRVVGIIYFITFITSGFLILRWIHRSNNNIRAAGAENLKFTPGWSIGYYFIPFLSLWKPYQAMKEIWKASINPKKWEHKKTPGIFPLWWTFWVISNIGSSISLRLSEDNGSIEYLQGINIFNQILFGFDIVCSIALIAIIRQTHKNQKMSLKIISSENNKDYSKDENFEDADRPSKKREINHPGHTQTQIKKAEQIIKLINKDISEKWEVLIEYCPMMTEYHKRLNQLSGDLADRYMAVACKKNYLDKDGRLMKRILSLYLEKHYGKNEDIQKLALDLIRGEKHNALVYLKKHIDIIGDQVSPREIIEKIEDKFFQPSDLIDAIKRIMAYNDSFYSRILNENNQTILHLFISKQLSSVGYDVVEKGKQVVITGEKNRYEFDDRIRFAQEIRRITERIAEAN